MELEGIKRVLVIRTSSFGDIILTTPLLRALAKAMPAAKIDFFTKAQYQSLLEHHPSVRVIGFDPAGGLSGLWAGIKKLRAEHYDLVIDLQVNPRSVFIRYLSGTRLRRRYRKYSLERRLLKFGVNLMKTSKPVAERYFSAVADFGILPNGNGPEIFFSKAELDKVDAILAGAGLAGKPVVGLAPGASKFTKRWPAERFAAAGAIVCKRLGAGAVVLGGREDAESAGQTMAGLRALGVTQLKNLAGELTILESSAMISRCNLLISNDSALMHLATATQTPVAAVFGATSRELGFFPLGQKARVLEVAGLECRPCTLHGEALCKRGHFRCMLEIAPEQVADAGLELLGLKKHD